MTLFCSTIIPTVGRPSLAQAVHSVLQQELADAAFELIVVNDSGAPLPPADWQQSPQVRLINTNRRERSLARNSGAAVASGRFLHFLDDDDWLRPGALQHFHELAGQSRAAWLYGSSQLVDRQGRPLIQLHHRLQGNCFLPVVAGEWIPLQASLINSQAFFAVGGFNPILSGPEDIDLLRRVALHHEIAGIETIVANIVRGEAGSTTDYNRHPIASRWAREKILDAPGCFRRLRAGAGNGYWHGRIARAYLTSMVWNLQRKRLWTAASRAGHGGVALLLAGTYLFGSDFWRAVTRSYENPTFARGFAEAHGRSR